MSSSALGMGRRTRRSTCRCSRLCAPRSPRSSFNSRKHQRGKIAGTPVPPAYCAQTMEAGLRRQVLGEPSQVFGGHRGLVGEHDHDAVGRGRCVGEAFANGAGDAFGPVAVDGHGGRTVLEQRRELAGMGAEHHGHGVTREFDGAADDGVHERPSVDAHQLLGGAKSRGGARRQYHDVDMVRLGGGGVHGSVSAARGIRSRPRRPRRCRRSWRSCSRLRRRPSAE